MSVWAKQKGFTIVELLVVIVVISILATVSLVAYGGVQARSKDVRRANDMKIILDGLALYKAQTYSYPSPSTNGPGSWEVSYLNPSQFLQILKTTGSSTVPVDPVNSTTKFYRYFRYSAGGAGCDASRGAYFVLGVIDMESSGRPAPNSPGWSCPGRDWATEFDWVTGGFEN